MVCHSGGWGEEIQLPVWINTPLEVQISQWLATKEAWDKRIAGRALEGKLLAPKSKKKYDTRQLKSMLPPVFENRVGSLVVQ